MTTGLRRARSCFLLPKKVTKRGIDLKRVGEYGNPDE